MDIKKLRNLSKKELEGEKNKLDDELSKLRKEQWQEKLKDTNAIRNKRKDLARILTLIEEKEVLESLSEAKGGGVTESRKSAGK